MILGFYLFLIEIDQAAFAEMPSLIFLIFIST